MRSLHVCPFSKKANLVKELTVVQVLMLKAFKASSLHVVRA